MREYYLDIETTGIDFDKDEVITIQWQELDVCTGRPISELNILKSWESSEKEILQSFLPNLKCAPSDFIMVGKNLLFDFCFLDSRMRKYELGGLDLRFLYKRMTLDIKSVLVLMNNGRFGGYDEIIPKTSTISNKDIPQLFKSGKYNEIVQYILDEANDFIKFYRMLKSKMPSLRPSKNNITYSDCSFLLAVF